MEHAAGSRDAEVRLQVGVVVPHQRAHAVALGQAEPLEAFGEGFGPANKIGVRIAMKRLVGPARDDLHRAEQFARALQQVR